MNLSSNDLLLTKADLGILARADEIKTAAFSISANYFDCPSARRIAHRHFGEKGFTDRTLETALEVALEDIVPNLAKRACDAYFTWAVVDGFAGAWLENCKTNGFSGTAQAGTESTKRTAQWREKACAFANTCADTFRLTVTEYAHLYREKPVLEFSEQLDARLAYIASIDARSSEHGILPVDPAPALHLRMVAAYAATTRAYVDYLALVDADVALSFCAHKLGHARVSDPANVSGHFDDFLGTLHMVEDLRADALPDIYLLGQCAGTAHHNTIMGGLTLNTAGVPHLRLKQ